MQPEDMIIPVLLAGQVHFKRVEADGTVFLIMMKTTSSSSSKELEPGAQVQYHNHHLFLSIHL